MNTASYIHVCVCVCVCVCGRNMQELSNIKILVELRFFLALPAF
jgi:hypothetical protein